MCCHSYLALKVLSNPSPDTGVDKIFGVHWNRLINALTGEATENFIFDGTLDVLGTARSGNPTTVTNINNYLRQMYISAQESTDPGTDKAYNALTVETLPTSSAHNYQVALYAGAKAPQNFDGRVWAINALIQLNGTNTSTAGTCIEVDVDNFQADGKGKGVLITGASSFNPYKALEIGHMGVHNWQYGITMTRVLNGVTITLDNSGGTNGISMSGTSNPLSGWLKITPSDDLTPTGTAIYMTDAADTRLLWGIDKGGRLRINQLSGSTLDFLVFQANNTTKLKVASTGATTLLVDDADPLIINMNALTASRNVTFIGAGSGFALLTKRANNTIASPTNVVNTDKLFSITLQGYDGTAYSTGALMQCVAVEDWSNTAHGARLDLAVTQTSTITNKTTLRLDSDLTVLMGSNLRLQLTDTGLTAKRQMTFPDTAGQVLVETAVNSVSPTSPNRTITVNIGGTSYYIHAKTTND